MSADPIIVQLCAAPGTGKGQIVRSLVGLLRHRDGDHSWIDSDNETGYGGYSGVDRWMDSQISEIGLDTPEFGKQFNLPRQLRYQESTRLLATFARANVIMPGPFENLFAEVPVSNSNEKLPLLEKLRKFDFRNFRLITIQVVLAPAGFTGPLTQEVIDDPQWIAATASVFRERLEERIRARYAEKPFFGTVQTALDQSKLDDLEGFTRKRIGWLFETHRRFNTPVVLYAADQSPEWAAAQIVQYIS